MEWAGPDWCRREWATGRWGTLWTDDLLEMVDGRACGWKTGAHGLAAPEDVPTLRLAQVALLEPAHNWICLEGRHYDAEHREGVENPLALNFFRRWLTGPLPKGSLPPT